MPESCTGIVKFSYPEAPKVTVSVSPTTNDLVFAGSEMSRMFEVPPLAVPARSEIAPTGMSW